MRPEEKPNLSRYTSRFSLTGQSATLTGSARCDYPSESRSTSGATRWSAIRRSFDESRCGGLDGPWLRVPTELSSWSKPCEAVATLLHETRTTRLVGCTRETRRRSIESRFAHQVLVAQKRSLRVANDAGFGHRRDCEPRRGTTHPQSTRCCDVPVLPNWSGNRRAGSGERFEFSKTTHCPLHEAVARDNCDPPTTRHRQ